MFTESRISPKILKQVIKQARKQRQQKKKSESSFFLENISQEL